MRLHTGKVVPDIAAKALNVNLTQMSKAGMLGALAVAEARKMAANPRHKVFSPRMKKLLEDYGILANGEIHDVTAAYILAATKVTGNGDIRFVNPRTGR